MDGPTCPMVQWDRMDSGIWVPSGGTVGYQETIPWYSGIGQTVDFWGGPQVEQWAPMDSPTCPMVQWDRTDNGI